MPTERSLDTHPPVHKTYTRGTHRTLAPGMTLQRLQALLPALGITRLANITGLDVLGLPVVMACRPLSRSLAVSQGKGLDLPAAKVSAIMESIEAHHAERIDAPLRYASYAELSQTYPVVDVSRLPQSAEQGFQPEQPMLWLQGCDLFSAAELWLPFELVSTDYTVPVPPGSGCFAANTNGLAAGNHFLEATAHACYELIERDAISLWRLRGDDALTGTGLDLQTVDDDNCQALLEQFERAQIDLRVWDVTSDTGVAVFNCLALDRDAERCDPEFGAGCHPNPAVALLRALTEAAQARATFIAGARDDFTLQHYAPAERARRRRECRRWFAAHRPCRDFRALAWQDGETLNEDLHWTAQQLAAVGIEQLIAVDLTQPAFGIPVVKMVIPGLEGAYEGTGSDYVPGQRAQAIRARRLP